MLDPPSFSSVVRDPITIQPTCNTQRILPVPICAPSLDLLLPSVKIKFKQQLNVTQILCLCEMPIEFELISEDDRILYRITETDNFVIRNCTPQGFRTDSVVTTGTTHRTPALHFRRDARCVFNCCLPCPPVLGNERLCVFGGGTGGTDLQLQGIVQQDGSAWRSRFSILDGTGNQVLKIVGPGCNFACGEDIEFTILSLTGIKIGSIVKHFTGIVQEALTDFDEFTLSFPRDLDVAVKATLMGAVFLINFLFFQGALRRLAWIPCAAVYALKYSNFGCIECILPKAF